MSHAARELTERFHLLGRAQPSLDRALLRDVAHRVDQTIRRELGHGRLHDARVAAGSRDAVLIGRAARSAGFRGREQRADVPADQRRRLETRDAPRRAIAAHDHSVTGRDQEPIIDGRERAVQLVDL